MLSAAQTRRQKLRGRKRAKSMLDVSGQSLKPERHGWLVDHSFWIDVPDRRLACELEKRICPVSGPRIVHRPRLGGKRKRSSSVAGLTARSIFAVEAVNQKTTFRQQAERWMITFKRESAIVFLLATAAGYRSYLNKWLNANLWRPADLGRR